MQTLDHTYNILFIYLAASRMSRAEMEKDITELWQLAESLGIASVKDLIYQKGEESESTYIGPGKSLEVAEYLETHQIDVIIFNGQLKPGQKFNLLKKFWDIRPNIQIWDRIDLILAIFSRHARTTEAKLQIELAQIYSMGPRIFGMGMELSRQGGGIGTRGIGETNTELMKRHWRREIKRAKDTLEKVTSSHIAQMDHRRSIGLQTISIVGYTNAGKTSLFNILTHKKNLVENALFATLDSAVGEIFLPSIGKKALISDTIGFIAHLPPTLIDAFKSTLLESIHADVVLHVIDASDPYIREKIEVVNDILNQLDITPKKEIIVFNKIDLVSHLDRQKLSDLTGGIPQAFISTKTHEGMESFLSTILPNAIQSF